MHHPLPSNFPEETIFIIDGLIAAFTVALLCPGQSIRCIYECKEVQWRKVDFIALYDLLLADVDIREKRIVNVPHPYFLQGKSFFGTIRKQKRFIRRVKDIVTLDSNETYCGCVTSSILLANKRSVPHFLMDEGMDSIMARHRLYRRGSSVLLDRLREIVAGFLIPFRFHRDTPQITMANDEHDSISLRKDYRDFHSYRFNHLALPLQDFLNKNNKNILALVKGPPHLSANSLSGNLDMNSKYIEFNIKAIKRFIATQPQYVDACFYLKTHPSLGADSQLVDSLLSGLKRNRITARDICEGMSFEELPSLPAEAFLATGKFCALLSLDISSTLWHVCHDQSLECFMPLDDIINLAYIDGSAAQLSLLKGQYELNRINGSRVIFY